MTALATAPLPATRTEAQRMAARQNGKKSQGPKTEAGKNSSRRNAIKHGCSPKTELFPDDLQTQVDNDLDGFRQHFQPQTEYESHLVHVAAVAAARLTRLLQGELVHTQSRVRHATENWDAARAQLIDELAALLEIDPATALRELCRTAEGCDYLADAWDSLVEALSAEKSLKPAENRRLYLLLGHSEPPSEDSHLAHAVNSDDASDDESLLVVMTQKRDELIERADRLWTDIDGPDRDEAPTRALFDPSPEFARVARYISSAERMQRQALRELARLRKEDGSSLRHSPSDLRPSCKLEHPRKNEPGATQPSAPQSRKNEPGASQPSAPQSRKNEPGATQPSVLQPEARPRFSPRDPFDDLLGVPSNRRAYSYVPISAAPEPN